jgi:signal transduction histidine kinase
MIEIKDTGCGIRPEVRDRIFEPFFTTKPLVGQQMADEPTGTGLGLSSALQLMRRYDAKFEIQSEIGQGTTFRMIIPHQQKDQAQPAEDSLLREQEAEAMIA